MTRSLAAWPILGWILAALILGSPGMGLAQRALVLASTTSVENSGLLGHILPRFTARTGIAVRVLALGTGQASADRLISPEGQDAIGTYTVAGEKLFHPAADPKP